MAKPERVVLAALAPVVVMTAMHVSPPQIVGGLLGLALFGPSARR